MKRITSVVQRVKSWARDLRQPDASDTSADDYAARILAADANDASDEELEAAERIMDDLEAERVSDNEESYADAEPEYRQGVKKDAKGIMSGKCPDCGGRLARDIIAEQSITFNCAGKRNSAGCGYKAEVLMPPEED